VPNIGLQKTASREIFSFENSNEMRGRVCNELMKYFVQVKIKKFEMTKKLGS
jgi:hypothetical protein